MLLEGQEAKMSPEVFREMCESGLSGVLRQAALAMLDGADAPHPFVRAWRDADAQVRNAIAAERARKRGLPAAQTPRLDASGCDASISPAIAAAFALPDPLSRERAIAHVRWAILDQLQGVDPLSENVVLAFAAKLKINTLLLSADPSKGAESFKAITTR